MIGHRWSLRDHKVRNFLSRNHVPYRWLDVAGNEDAAKLLSENQLDPGPFAGGAVYRRKFAGGPGAGRTGGAGGPEHAGNPGFLRHGGGGRGAGGIGSGSVRSQRRAAHADHRARSAGRGQAGSTSRIENFLGFPSGITGADLGRRAHIQATRFGAEFLTPAGDRVTDRRPIPHGAIGRWERGFHARGDAGSRRSIPQARHSRR